MKMPILPVKSKRTILLTAAAVVLLIAAGLIIFRLHKGSTLLKPAIPGLAATVAGPSGQVISEGRGSDTHYAYLLDNPGNYPDYKWQFLATGIRLEIDRHDNAGWQTLVNKIELEPQYQTDKTWQDYTLTDGHTATATLAGWQKLVNPDHTVKMVRTLNAASPSSESEIFTEAWAIPADPTASPKATFSQTDTKSGTTTSAVPWRLKWLFDGVPGITEDNIDMRGSDNWPIRSQGYADNDLTIDVNDFDNLTNDPAALEYSQYAPTPDNGGSTAGRVEIIFYPNGTTGARTIDPTLVIAGMNLGWADGNTRNVFYNGSYFFLIYFSNGDTLYYKSSADGSAWSATSTLWTPTSGTSIKSFSGNLVNDTILDMAVQIGIGQTLIVQTFTISSGSLTGQGAETVDSTSFNNGYAVAITRTPSANRIWVVATGDNGGGTGHGIIKAFYRDAAGDTTGSGTWTAPANGAFETSGGLDPATIIPYRSADKIAAVWSHDAGGTNSDGFYSNTIDINNTAGTMTSLGATYKGSGNISYSSHLGNCVNMNTADNDFACAMVNESKNLTLATTTDAGNTTAWGTEIIDSGTTWNNPSLFLDRQTGDLYVFAEDDTTGTNYAIYRFYHPAGGSWQAGVEADRGDALEIGNRSFPATQAYEPPLGSTRLSPRYLIWAYRTLLYNILYDLYVSTTRLDPSLFVAADQTFYTDESATAISPLTIVCHASSSISASNDIRIKIDTSKADMYWDTSDTSASISGTAAGKVSSTVSYESASSTLVIDVTGDFGQDQYITVSGLSFADFGNANAATSSVFELYTGGSNDSVADALATATVAIKGSITVGNHTLGQVSNQWSGVTATTSVHFRFKLTPNGEHITIGTTTIDLSQLSGIAQGDITNATLYEDLDSNGKIDTGGTGFGPTGGPGSGTVGTSSSQYATRAGFQRKTWYDGARYWAGFHDNDNNRIEFWYSTNGTNWSEDTNARITSDTDDFSVDADSHNAFVAYTNTANNNIDIKEASSTTNYPGASFSWSNAASVFSGSGNAYSYPALTRDTNDKVWVTARASTTISQYSLLTKQSSAADSIFSWGALDTLIATSDTNRYGIPFALSGGDMFAVIASSTSLYGKEYTPGSGWATSTDFIAAATTTLDRAPSAVSSTSTNDILINYVDNNGKANFLRARLATSTQELAPTAFSGSNAAYYVSTAMVGSDSVAIAYTDSTDSNIGKFVVYNIDGTQELAPTAFSGVDTADHIGAAMVDSDSVVIAYRDNSGSGSFTVRNVLTGAQELAPTAFTTNNIQGYIIGAAMVDSDSVVIAYQDSTDSLGKFTVMNVLTGAQELAPTVFSGTDYVLYVSVAKVDADSVVFVYSDNVTTNASKFTVYSIYGNQELAPTNFSDTHDVTYLNTAMVNSDSVVIAYNDAGDGNVGKLSVYNVDNGNQELAPTAFSGVDGTYYISTAMADSDSAVIAYDRSDNYIGKLTVRSVPTWYDPVTIDSTAGAYYPTIALDRTHDNRLYAFWQRGNDVYYSRASSPYSDWLSPAALLTSGTNSWLTANARDAGGYMTFLYTANNSSPYDIDFYGQSSAGRSWPGQVSISGNSGTISFATSTTWGLSEPADFLVELTAQNLGSSASSSATNPPFQVEGSVQMQGNITFAGTAGSGGSGSTSSSMTIGFGTISGLGQTSGLSTPYIDNSSSVTHSN